MRYIIGLHAIEEWIKRYPAGGCLYISKFTKRNKFLSGLGRSRGYGVAEISENELSRRAGMHDHKGIALQVAEQLRQKAAPKEFTSYATLPENAVVLILDEITDSGNYGAILRSAEMFSVDLVIIPRNRSVTEDPRVTKGSAGADAYVSVYIAVNISRELEKLKEAGFWIFAADMAGQPLWKQDMEGKIGIVLGSEGRGVRPNVVKHCDGVLAIPTAGRLDSLNVSVAAGIMLYEIRRQQQKAK